MSTRTKILAAVAGLAVLVLVLSRGGEPSARLQALEADPMATYVPAGGRLVETDSQDEGRSLGKAVSASYTRMFQLPAGTGPPELAQARDAATAADWRPAGSTDARTFVARKRLSAGRTELDVRLFVDSLLLPKGVKPPALLIRLRDLGP